MKRLFVCLLLLAGILLPAQAIYFRHIGMTEGLSQVSVLSIYQDCLGRMWFGTEEGLNIYDGLHMAANKPSNYRSSDGTVVGNRILFLTGDEAGNVYFNADNSLFRYDLATQQIHTLRKNGVRALFAQGDCLWVGVNDSICRYDTRQQEFHFFCRLAHPDLYATSLLIDTAGRCWIGTNRGVYLQTDGQQTVPVATGCEIPCLFEDSRHGIWISTDGDGLYRYQPDGSVTHFRNTPDGGSHQLSNNHVRHVTEDSFGHIWIGTFMGLDRYNPYDQRFTIYRNDNRPGSLSHSSVFPLYKDRQGTLWIGTYYGGVNYCNPESDLFSFYSADASSTDCLSYPYVGNMVEDKDGNLWIGTEGGGLNFMDRRTKRFTHFTAKAGSNSIAHNNVKSLVYDEQRERLYIGTHTGGLSVYDIRSGRFNNLLQRHPDYASRYGDRIYRMELHGDTLLFSSQTGIWKMNVNTEAVTEFLPYAKFYTNNCFLTDRKGHMWIAGGKGMYCMDPRNRQSLKYYRYDENGLGHFAVEQMLEDWEGRLFFGTKGSGVYRYVEEEDRFLPLNTPEQRVTGDYCYGLGQSPTGHLLITSEKGLTSYDADNGSFQQMELNAALPLTGINSGCGLLVCRDGEIFLGGTNGLAAFHGQLLGDRLSKDYHLYFTELYINNERVRPAQPASLLPQAIYYTDHLDLRHDENDLTLEFATDNYIAPLHRPVYEYRLEGLDAKWTVTSSNSIHYTNLGAGHYTLRLREKLYNAKQEPQEICLSLVVHPPFYATPLFYLLYAVTAFSIILGIFRFKQAQFRLKTSLEMEKKDKERIEELTQAKLQFFANISHEFRTPLTLVITQLDLLMQDNGLSAALYNKVVKVYRNTYHLRNLITELLDFRKLEQGHVKLQVSKLDMVPYLKEIYLTFADYAQSRNIRYTFCPSQESVICWFDPQQMEKVVYNLLSNAFKYTPQGGSIELNVSETDKEIVVKVIDSGIGIQKEDLDKIFDRFYQAGNRIADIARTPSTGIGLALVKNVTELHHGTVKVESAPDYGSIFIVRLQKGRAHFTDEECTRQTAVSDAHLPSDLPEYPKELAVPTQEEHETEEEHPETSRHSILIVEDNEELLGVLGKLFAPMYEVRLAHDGQEALELVRMKEPDLVVSDIMMPRVSGTELCTQLKNDFQTCHIPVVLLTALGTTEQSITGLKLGADEYISKPFNTDILVARCNNLVRNRHLLQKKYRQEVDCSSQLLATNPIDQKFLEDVNEVLEKNLDNPDFVIDELASALALSRSTFYSKFKSLTGMTPNDFVLLYKLKRAAQWLHTQPQLQVADITYKLGFSSPRYFTRCFKAQYGVTPTDYRKNKKASDNNDTGNG